MDLENSCKTQIDIMVQKIITKNDISDYIDMLVRFPQMPYYNILLILAQNPAATFICGKNAWTAYGAKIRELDKPIILFSPDFYTENDIMYLGITPQPLYDISQVSLPDKKIIPSGKHQLPDLVETLRDRHSIQILMDDDKLSVIRNKLVLTRYLPDSKKIYINPSTTCSIDPTTNDKKNRECLKHFAEYVISQNQTIETQYESELADYLTESLHKYYGLNTTFISTTSDLFVESIEIKSQFLQELGNLFFTAIQGLSDKQSLSFIETMMVNLFFDTTDRQEIENQINEITDYCEPILLNELIGIMNLLFDEKIMSDESLKILYQQRCEKKLFTFPSFLI